MPAEVSGCRHLMASLIVAVTAVWIVGWLIVVVYRASLLHLLSRYPFDFAR